MAQLLTLGENWKAKHQVLYEAKSHDAIRLRMHRAFSWMRKAETFALPERMLTRVLYFHGWL